MPTRHTRSETGGSPLPPNPKPDEGDTESPLPSLHPEPEESPLPSNPRARRRGSPLPADNTRPEDTDRNGG